MMKFLITNGRKTLKTHSWRQVYGLLCELQEIDARTINEKTHMDFANAESWCELLCNKDNPVYRGRGFTVMMIDDNND